MQGFYEYEEHEFVGNESISTAHNPTNTNPPSSIPSTETPIKHMGEAEAILKTPEAQEKTITAVEEKPTVTAATPSQKWQPRRTTMRIYEQPGQLLANYIPAAEDGLPHIILGPRKKVIATWKLPLGFLRQYALKKLQEKDKDGAMDATKLTLQDAIQTLTVGLFRRGCA